MGINLGPAPKMRMFGYNIECDVKICETCPHYQKELNDGDMTDTDLVYLGRCNKLNKVLGDIEPLNETDCMNQAAQIVSEGTKIDWGFTGFSGWSGFSGTLGFSGTSGYSATTGHSGSSGYSGICGTGGLIGSSMGGFSRQSQTPRIKVVPTKPKPIEEKEESKIGLLLKRLIGIK